MKRTIFISFLMLVLALFLSSCAGFDIEIKNPEGETVFYTNEETQKEPETEQENMDAEEHEQPEEPERPEPAEIPLEGEYVLFDVRDDFSHVVDCLEIGGRLAVIEHRKMKPDEDISGDEMFMSIFDPETGEKLFEFPYSHFGFVRKMMPCEDREGLDFCVLQDDRIVYYSSNGENGPVAVPLPEELQSGNYDICGEKAVWISEDGKLNLRLSEGGETEILTEASKLKEEFYGKIDESFALYPIPEDIAEPFRLSSAKFILGGEKIVLDIFDNHCLYFATVIYDIESRKFENGFAYTEMQIVQTISDRYVVLLKQHDFKEPPEKSSYRVIDTKTNETKDFFAKEYDEFLIAEKGGATASVNYDSIEDIGLEVFIKDENGERSIIKVTDSETKILVDKKTENYILLRPSDEYGSWLAAVNYTGK